MHYIVYKITNLINNKIYVGVHSTNNLDDNYMSSSKLVKNAIKKYGKENFKREILYNCSSFEQMFEIEQKLVTEEFCKRGDTYNICPGGLGGFGYLNNHPKKSEWCKKGATSGKNANTEWKSLNMKRIWAENTNNMFIPTTMGFKHSNESKQKMSVSHYGSNNSQYGTMWITNGCENRKIKRTVDVPEGWYRGRALK